jgi:hypothetical protein
VSLEPGATATAYGAGAIYLNGVVNTPVNFQNKTDSTNAFQIQNSSSIALLVVDSAGKNIQIGSSTTDTNAVFITLDSYSTAADPTAPANGAMYYNTSTNVFRCRENGVWKNCIDPPSNASTADQPVGASATAYLTGSKITIPQGGVKVGTQFIWRISLSKTNAGTVAPVYDVRVGSAGDGTDASRVSFTMHVGTAAPDTATVTIIVTVRSVSASGTWAGNIQLVHTAAAATGFESTASINSTVVNTTSATFDDSALSGQFVGVSITTGASYSLTFQQVQAQTVNL